MIHTDAELAAVTTCDDSDHTHPSLEDARDCVVNGHGHGRGISDCTTCGWMAEDCPVVR